MLHYRFTEKIESICFDFDNKNLSKIEQKRELYNILCKEIEKGVKTLSTDFNEVKYNNIIEKINFINQNNRFDWTLNLKIDNKYLVIIMFYYFTKKITFLNSVTGLKEHLGMRIKPYLYGYPYVFKHQNEESLFIEKFINDNFTDKTDFLRSCIGLDLIDDMPVSYSHTADLDELIIKDSDNFLNILFNYIFREEIKENEEKEEVEVKEVVEVNEENEVTEVNEVVTKENINSIAEKILAIFINKTSLSLESCQVLIKDFYRKLTNKFNEKLSKKTIKAIEENIYIYRTFTYNFLLNVFNGIQEVNFVYTIENNIKQIDNNKLEEWMQCQLTSEEFTRMKKSCLNELNKPFELPKSYNKEDLTTIKDFKRDFNNIISFIPTNERKYNNINFIENALTIATKGNFIKYTTYNNKGGFSVNISEFKKTLDNIKTDCIIKAGCINNISFDYSKRTLDAPVIEKKLTEKGNAKKIFIDSIELTNALKNCLPICLKEKEDARKQLQMPCLYFDKNKSYLISTDAKQIIKYDLDIINNTYFNKPYSLYIPFDIAKGLLYNLENHKYSKGEDGWPLSEKVEIIFHKNLFEIIFNELNIICNYININPIGFTPFLNEIDKCQIIFDCNSNDLFKTCENATQYFTEDIYNNPVKAFAFIYNGKELILKNENARLAIPTFKLNENIGFNAFNPALIANVLKNKNIDITVYIANKANKEENKIPLFIKYGNYTYSLMPVVNDFQEIAKNELTEVNEVKEVVEVNEVTKKVNTEVIKQVIITVLKSLVNIKTSLIKYIIIREVTKEKELLIIHNITKRSRPPPENLRRLSNKGQASEPLM